MSGNIYNMRGDRDYGTLSDLISFVRFGNANGKKIVMVEVGSYAGQSMECFAKSGMVAAICCIDPWEGGWDSRDPASSTDMAYVESLFDKRMESMREIASVVKFKWTFKEFVKSPVYQKFVSDFGDVDFVYIDALHTYDGAKGDIEIARDIVKPTLAIGGHDYVRRWDGVIRAVDETVGKPDRVFSDYSWVRKIENDA